MHALTTRHTTAEIVSARPSCVSRSRRCCNGDDIFDCEQFVARGVFVDDPTGTFKHAAAVRGASTIATRRRPAQHPGSASTLVASRSARPTPSRPAPLRRASGGSRSTACACVDLTAWWAGPVAAGMIAALGADVIHVESVGRIDGMRTTGRMSGNNDAWWERGSHYLCANANKRDLTLDLTRPEGRELLERLIARERRGHRELHPTRAGELRPRPGTPSAS